jgi:transcriptional regulator with XRE-family HTH domain
MTGRQLADRLGWGQSKVSKLENGKQTPTADDLKAWAEAAGAPEVAGELTARLSGFETHYRAWRRQLAAGHRARQELGTMELARSRIFQGFEPGIVPGIFQTADYARYLFALNADFRQTPRDTEEAVRARVKRQGALYESGRVFRVLLWEGALHVLICPPGVMNAQLDRLMSVMGLDTVKLGIIPLGAPVRRSPAHGFWIYDDRLVTVETINTEMWLDSADDIALYLKAWDWLAESAVFGRGARRLIAHAQAALETP